MVRWWYLIKLGKDFLNVILVHEMKYLWGVSGNNNRFVHSSHIVEADSQQSE